MSLRRVLFVLGAASGTSSSCSLIYSLDGFDQRTPGTGGGTDAGADADAAATEDDGGAEAPSDAEMGPCTDMPDGTTCPARDACHAWACKADACAQGKALPDGTAFDSSKHTACCGGAVVSLTTDQNCNVCGLTCNSPLTCQPQGTNPTVYQCVGCQTYGAPYCWTSNKCCVDMLNPKGVCAASSDCNGSCTSACPNGSKCVGVGMHPTDVDNFCSY
jgi:hypothetical protein